MHTKTMIPKDNRITFITVNYNSKKDLLRSLSDLSKIDNADKIDVIIVNNDTSKLELPTFSFANQIVCEINSNIGFGAANNIALDKIQTEYVCFLNPDTYSFPKNLLKIIEHIKHDKMIVAPQICTPKNNPEPWSVGSKINLCSIIKNNLGLYKKYWNLTTPTEVAWVSGASLFAKTHFIKQLGGFDEDFFLYFEDVDLCQRAKNRGGSIMYLPDFQIKHSSGSSSNTKHLQKRHYYDSQYIFFKKHVGVMQAEIIRLFHFFIKR